jgi:hypothetical protein
MKTRLVGLFAAIAIMVVSVAAQPQPSGPKVSADELKAAQAIEAAPDAAGKVKAGGDFIKKYPKSSIRDRVAGGLVDEITKVQDPTQRIDLAHNYQASFTSPTEQELILPTLIDALAQAKRSDEAFTAGSAFLSKNPDSILVLVRLVSVGTEEAKFRNPKFVSQSLQYGTHAIELIEANKTPAGMDAAAWSGYKRTLMPSLYQSMGVLNFVSGDRENAKVRLTKSSELAPADAFNYLILGGIADEEYQAAAKAYQAMANGAPREQALQKAHEILDRTVDLYAHFVAVSEGNARFTDSRTQTMQILEAYYKYRHNGSTEGLQQLIEKYKTPAKP